MIAGLLPSKLSCAFCIFVTSTVSFTSGSVSIQFGFGALRDATGHLAAPGSLWLLAVSPPEDSLPGGLEENSSLSASLVPFVRADFGGCD